MTTEEKEQLIIILRSLALSACQTEDNYRYCEDLIRDLSDMFLDSDDEQDELL